jgi:hypothetical protein
VSIPFTQYLRPNGETRDESIERSPEIEKLALEAFEKGVRYEAEVLRTGQVSFTAMLDGDAIAHEVVPNGPAVVDAVDRLVRATAERLKAVP